MQKDEKKKQLARNADVEMADATKPGPSIQSMIDKAVNARVKQMAGSSKKVSLSAPLIDALSDFHSAELSAEGWEVDQSFQQEDEERRALPLASFASTSSSTRQDGRPSQSSRGQKRKFVEDVGERQVLRRQGKGKEELIVGSHGPNFRYDNPSSYPDWLLTIPYPRAISYIILNTPHDIVLASQFKHTVHLSPGVSVPLEYQYQLSVGQRYMFPTPRNASLIKDAWYDFERRIRWRLYFAFQGDNNDLYDPDYEVHRTSVAKPPKLPPYIEQGLAFGKSFVITQSREINARPPEPAYAKSLTPDRHALFEFLSRNNYVVTGTDKNLGIAVSERTWIDEKCLDLLADRDNYRPIDFLMANEIFRHQNTSMDRIAGVAKLHLPNGDQISTFLRSKMTPRENGVFREHAVPTFYGIPKIHKVPTKMRPIIPCHSAIQNPAAKFVSKQLKPLIQGAPTILHGTKDLAIKLSKVNLRSDRRWFIVTGDVVAFYPNIPIDSCLEKVADMYMEFKWGGMPTTEQELHEFKIFMECLMVGNTRLVCKYKDKFYEQLRGLAMGVSDSPDLANLYGAYFEMNVCKIHNHPDVPFYGRFIDDCLAIVYATSETAAINIAKTVQFDGCTIEWEASESFANFLDMTIYKDENLSLQHRPYRKNASHMERIPWISAHPLDVKRGTFLGEMSRLATLSSTFNTYSEALRGLAALYVKRGYPSALVEAWLKNNVANKWAKRLEQKTTNDTNDVLVLKTVYNTAWNYFSARELGDRVLGYWKTYAEQAKSEDFVPRILYPMFSSDVADLTETDPNLQSVFQTSDGPCLMPDISKLDILNRKLITSRKRTRNLFDLTSLWKKTLVARYEEDVVELTNDDDVSMDSVSSDNERSTDSFSDRSDGIDPNFFVQSVLGTWNARTSA